MLGLVAQKTAFKGEPAPPAQLHRSVPARLLCWGVVETMRHNDKTDRAGVTGRQGEKEAEEEGSDAFRT